MITARNGSTAIDKGKRLRGFNSDRPDLDPHKFGDEPPIDGPRSPLSTQPVR